MRSLCSQKIYWSIELACSNRPKREKRNLENGQERRKVAVNDGGHIAGGMGNAGDKSRTSKLTTKMFGGWKGSKNLPSSIGVNVLETGDS